MEKTITRRVLLGSTLAAGSFALLPHFGRLAQAATAPRSLTAGAATAPIVGGDRPDTAVWAYDGSVPGPEIRVRQGDTIRVLARNGLDQPTTVHWHGIRLPNAMDGVPDLTQEAISPGGEFLYEFKAMDAGSFWYHPHVNSTEQQGRGLAGALIVEEKEPIRVDRDVTWVIDDWLLQDTAQIDDSFGHPMQMSHGGRRGNTVTVNGRIPDEFRVRSGERIRLRLINVANARTFGLDFGDLRPTVIALDGQPVRPHTPDNGRVVLAAAQRVDLVIDMSGKPGDRVRVYDVYYRGRDYEFISIIHETGRPLRESPLDAPVALAANPLPTPVIDNQAQHETIVLAGGAMGRMPPDANKFVRQGQFWFLNGLPAAARKGEPIFSIASGRTCIVRLVNETGWEHPMHLHGYAFRVIARNDRPNMRGEWLDTVLVHPRESVDVAFVADNPGDWMFHCHILEHMAAGMSCFLRVA
jgi:FtsP/CotA-like multicopper oxidase with cupredoxin domain